MCQTLCEILDHLLRPTPITLLCLEPLQSPPLQGSLPYGSHLQIWLSLRTHTDQWGSQHTYLSLRVNFQGFGVIPPFVFLGGRGRFMENLKSHVILLGVIFEKFQRLN